MNESRIEFVDIEGAREIRRGVAVVVDVMRAFTTAAWALHRGARELILVDDIEEAVAIAATIPDALLAKDGVPDPRFDLHNSPAKLLDHDVRGRAIVQRTNAGTRAAVAARGADRMLCASFVCATATATHLESIGAKDVAFVVSGGLDAEEDLACAELIALTRTEGPTDPAAYLDRANRSTAADGLRSAVGKGYVGVAADDVPICLEHDRFDFGMEVSKSGPNLVLRRSVQS